MTYLTSTLISTKKFVITRKELIILGAILLAAVVYPLADIGVPGRAQGSYNIDYVTISVSPDTGWPAAPTNLNVAVTGADTATVSWIKAPTADTTMVRVKIGSYPINVADGAEAYNGIGNSVDIAGLALGTDIYYYRAWSHNVHGYSFHYDSANTGSPTNIGAILIRLLLRLLIAAAIIVAAVRLSGGSPLRMLLLTLIGLIGFVIIDLVIGSLI